MAKCKFDGCVKEAATAGYCPGHYQQHRQGKPLKPLQLQFHGLTEKERFLKRVVMPDNPKGCWIWTGSKRKVKRSVIQEWHGQWRNANGNIELAHRASWRFLRGEIPDGMCILHKCDNPFCVNPAHLFIGTQSDNAHDMWNKGRGRPGVSLGEAHGCSVLREDQVREIRSSDKSGPELAKLFNCSTTTIYDIKNMKIWRHVK